MGSIFYQNYSLEQFDFLSYQAYKEGRQMKVSLRVILGVCFLIGALLFFYRGENQYALIFLVVGVLYLYKGLS